MKHVLTSVWALLLAASLTAAGLPSTLHPQPHSRDPYNWMTRHQKVIEANRTVRPEIIVIGDSIIHGWAGKPEYTCANRGPDSWKMLFGDRAVNMGFGFDYVENAYCRLQHGELDGIAPKLAVVMIGTNNLGHRRDTAEVCAAEIKALLELIRAKLPETKILLLGIFPRHERFMTQPTRDTNRLISAFADGRHIFYADVGDALRDGRAYGTKVNHSLYMDRGTHPNGEGYRRLAARMKPLIDRLLAK